MYLKKKAEEDPTYHPLLLTTLTTLSNETSSGTCEVSPLDETALVMDSLGVPIGSIQRILGHEQRSTTEIYLQSLGNSERQAMAVFEEASRNSHTDSHTASMIGEERDG